MNNLSWKVLREDNGNIKEYDIFDNDYWRNIVKILFKESKSKEDFEEAFRVTLMSMFWCRSEYEVVITSWPPYIDTKELANLDIEQEERFKKYGTYAERVSPNLTVSKKIDIYYQLQLNWKQFIDYVYQEVSNSEESDTANKK